MDVWMGGWVDHAPYTVGNATMGYSISRQQKINVTVVSAVHLTHPPNSGKPLRPAITEGAPKENAPPAGEYCATKKKKPDSCPQTETTQQLNKQTDKKTNIHTACRNRQGLPRP